MNARAAAEIPCFFGPGGGLFGIFHPAATAASTAVLLCPPLGQDMIRCHRLYRQLAVALAAAGYPVLRFDYHGTGDSAGDSADVEWPRCLADTQVAAERLRACSGCERLIGFGARMGGSVAMAADGARLDALLLWDPILDGQAHVARLEALQSSLPTDAQRFVAPRPDTAGAGQWLGFETGPRLRRQLVELRLEPTPRASLLLHSWPDGTTDDRERFSAHGTRVLDMPQPTPWDELARLETAIQSHALIDAARAHVQEVC